MKLIRISLLMCLLLIVLPIHAQGDVTVPDVSGLLVPEAAAELNRAGLRLGNQDVEEWTADSPNEVGSIAAQSVAAGEQVAYGTEIDITVYSAANVSLIYDDNDLTMVNRAGVGFSISTLSFNSSDGTRRFLANRWRGDLPAGDCTQIWSIARNQAKAVEGCDSVYWITTNNPDEHFWTQTAGVETFLVVQDGIQRASCDAAGAGTQDRPLSCDFFVATDAQSGATTPYIYFAYTAETFIVMNTSADRWMPTTSPTIYNFNPALSIAGVGLQLGDPQYFQVDESVVGDVARLAPNQCLLLTTIQDANVAPPQPCDVIAQRTLSPEVIFWAAAFELDTPLSNERSSCPAANSERLVICIMPR